MVVWDILGFRAPANTRFPTLLLCLPKVGLLEAQVPETQTFMSLCKKETGATDALSRVLSMRTVCWVDAPLIGPPGVV